MNDKKAENRQLQIQQAQAKRKAIIANSNALVAKLNNIQQQLEANKKKVAKIDFFLQKLNNPTGENNT